MQFGKRGFLRASMDGDPSSRGGNHCRLDLWCHTLLQFRRAPRDSRGAVVFMNAPQNYAGEIRETIELQSSRLVPGTRTYPEAFSIKRIVSALYMSLELRFHRRSVSERKVAGLLDRKSSQATSKS